MALFLNIFIVTSNSPVSIYRSICSCSHCFSGLLQGDHLRQSGPSMAAILGPGDHLRQHNLPQMVRGDQLWRGTNYSVTGPIIVTPKVNGTPIQMELETEASVTLISARIWGRNY